MTYRELIEQCPNVGLNGNGCDNCECDKECDYFITITGYVPSYYKNVVVELDLDKEIGVNDVIIRCKDCANSVLMVDGTYACEINALGVYNNANDFCSWAERKDLE